VDTDQIIPARFLTATGRQGFGRHLFADWRYLPDGSPQPSFVLNQPQAQGAKILLVGRNFGCGSSREHAVWALMGWGFRAVIALSFADIFRANSLKNGLLPVELAPPVHSQLAALATENPQALVEIDLQARRLRAPGGIQAEFPIDPFSRHCLLHGIDPMDYLLSFEGAISRYEAERDDG
jgi:3-isopropylmalate/(R)-2-methylmalate dehydratase small subunit